MKPNYYTEFLVKSSPELVMACICNVQRWWSTNFDGQSANLDDTFHVRFGKTWADIQVTILLPGRMSWKVTDCYLNLLKDTQEWRNTQINWQVETEAGITKVIMEHAGMVPELECFKDCSNGWNFFINSSLKKLITEGKGSPAVGIHGYVKHENKTYKGTLFYKNDPLPDLSKGDLIIDVKTNAFEQVIAAYSIQTYDGQLKKLYGDNYLVLEAVEDEMASILKEALC